MRHCWFLLFVALTFVSCNAPRAINVAKFEQRIQATPEAVILDVRTPKEFAEGHLPNAINIDYRGGDLKLSLDSLDKDKVYLLYCKSGGRSAASVKMLDSAGFKHVVDLKGGITKWKEEGKPLEAE